MCFKRKYEYVEINKIHTTIGAKEDVKHIPDKETISGGKDYSTSYN